MDTIDRQHLELSLRQRQVEALEKLASVVEPPTCECDILKRRIYVAIDRLYDCATYYEVCEILAGERDAYVQNHTSRLERKDP